MYTYTAFVPKKTVEETTALPGREKILISITSPAGPGCSPAVLHDGAWNDVLRLEFHDIDHESKDLVVFNDDHAESILRFLKIHEDSKTTDVVVHCEAGISRSAAVSKFVSQIYNLYFPVNYSLYNKYVFSTLLSLYGKCIYGEGPVSPEDLPRLP